MLDMSLATTFSSFWSTPLSEATRGQAFVFSLVTFVCLLLIGKALDWTEAWIRLRNLRFRMNADIESIKRFPPLKRVYTSAEQMLDDAWARAKTPYHPDIDSDRDSDSEPEHAGSIDEEKVSTEE